MGGPQNMEYEILPELGRSKQASGLRSLQVLNEEMMKMSAVAMRGETSGMRILIQLKAMRTSRTRARFICSSYFRLDCGELKEISSND